MPKVVMAYSGGLETTVCLHWLHHRKGFEVYTFSADLGQSESAEELSRRALEIGVNSVHIADLRETFIRDFVFPTLRAGAKSDSDSFLSVALSRLLITQEVVRIAEENVEPAVHEVAEDSDPIPEVAATDPLPEAAAVAAGATAAASTAVEPADEAAPPAPVVATENESTEARIQRVLETEPPKRQALLETLLLEERTERAHGPSSVASVVIILQHPRWQVKLSTTEPARWGRTRRIQSRSTNTCSRWYASKPGGGRKRSGLRMGLPSRARNSFSRASLGT